LISSFTLFFGNGSIAPASTSSDAHSFCSFMLNLFLTFCSALRFVMFLRASLVPFAVTFCSVVLIFCSS
jgi:hypothetical protein